MVTRRRGRDWIFKRLAASNLAQSPGFLEIAIFDIVAPADVRTMTTASVLRVLLRWTFTTDVNWSTGPVSYYVAVLPEAPADPNEGIYSEAIAPTTYDQISWENDPQMYNTRDPMYSESLIMLATDTFYGEPSDNPGFLRADIRTKRHLNDGDRLCVVLQAQATSSGGNFSAQLDAFTLVRAA